ncbi:hypothetical protein BX616_011262 [Lobosporangium transversale]|uniref:AMP-activated protein kinase glycogen-binding domain-containing protein n=1 Tax=Lobosporangium transversale TaxID=64571 RepID=A0A1Y2H147_9FUNG|nr:hypothetical protein BCR41DRAFT_347922 [Lobosporangium transversale]KAF9909176.1 hypothetical protein BX616_011262 [Lobosporangium transversale]ORZ26782.1 hypothetical protein BCR41DRAFT_347922 [Lobosporangium transversale]|eukprot:XP_021884545.1 hypothetical protein BCR41DRAFT_347922 [Lobosporangium transversale]
MLTTQIQILLYLGNIQIVSCSVFVPVPSIVVKSHQTLEAILPYLPLSLTAASEPDPKDSSDQQQQQQQQQQQLLLGPVPEPDDEDQSVGPSYSRSTSLVLSSRESHANARTSHTGHRTGGSNSNSVSSNRISPNSSIPATTCVKISLQPAPTFEFVKPKCPHLHQKHRNQRHLRQQQQQQQQQTSYPNAHSHPHRQSHRYSHRNSSNSAIATLECPSAGSVIVKFFYSFKDITSGSTASSSSAAVASLPELVQVTGTFNSWERTEPLIYNLETCRFEGQVSIPLSKFVRHQQQQQQRQELHPQSQASEKYRHPDDKRDKKRILYKFVLDNNSWVTDPDQQLERDQAGNLNNVLSLNEALTASATTSREEDGKEEESKQPVQQGSETEVSNVPILTEAAQNKVIPEPEMEEIARSKHNQEKERSGEYEDVDGTIHQLSGDMSDSTEITMSDPVILPQHFVVAQNKTSASTLAVEKEKNEEEEVVTAKEPFITPVVTETTTKECKRKSTSSKSEIKVTEAAVNIQAQDNNNKTESITASVIEEEDEDDKIIRELGGGVWGAPYFKVNDPTHLSEHFVGVLNHLDGQIVTDTNKDVTASETIATTGKDVHILASESVHKTETMDNTAVEATGGMFLEEFNVQRAQEPVAEAIKAIEEIESAPAAVIEASAPGTVTAAVMSASEGKPIVTTQDTQDSIEAQETVDTTTLIRRPEVNCGRLHKLTTAIKPIQHGESIIVEQIPETVIEDSVPAGDVEPQMEILNANDNDTDGEDSVVLLQGQPIEIATLPLTEESQISNNTLVSDTTKSPVDLSTSAGVVIAVMTTVTIASSEKTEKKQKRLSTLLKSRPTSSMFSGNQDSSSTIVTSTTVVTVDTSSSTASSTMNEDNDEEANIHETYGEKMEKNERRKSIWKNIKKVLA